MTRKEQFIERFSLGLDPERMSTLFYDTLFKTWETGVDLSEYAEVNITNGRLIVMFTPEQAYDFVSTFDPGWMDELVPPETTLGELVQG